jgi:hypothetical protein
MKKNEAFLPSERENNQTLIRALILSPNVHKKSNYLSLHHGRIQKCKKRRKTQDLLQKHAILTSHKLSPHTNSQDLTWQECQAKEEAPYLKSPLSTTKVFSSTSKWMKPYG